MIDRRNSNFRLFFTCPVSDPEHRGADHHWLQFMEGGEFFFKLFIFRSSFCLVLALPSSVLQYCPRVLAELSDLQEFYDPDTVELITWIRWVL